MSKNCDGADDSGSGGVSALSKFEKGTYNRKILSDLSSDVPAEESSLSLTEFPRYKITEKKIRNVLNELRSMMKRSEDTVEEQDMKEFQQSDWDDPLTCQLEELLEKTLFSTFSTAVNKIVERGFTREVAEWAVLHSSLFHGSADAVSNVIDSALAILKKEKKRKRLPKHPVFEGLQNLVDYTLLEMIYVLREVRPSLTLSEAMWCLLISNLDLVKACVAEGGAVCGSSSQEASGAIGTPAQSKTKTSAPLPCKSSTREQCHCELGKDDDSLFSPEVKGKLAAIVKKHVKASSQAAAMDAINAKKDILRHKAFNLERSCEGRPPRRVFKAKVAALGNMVMDKSRSQSSSSGVATKEPHMMSAISNDPSSNSSSPVPATSVKDPVFEVPSVTLKTEASTVPEASCGSKGDVNDSGTSKATDSYASIPFDETLPKHTPQYVKDHVFAVPAVNLKTDASTVPEASCGSKGEVNAFDTPNAIDFYASIPFDEILQKHIPQDDKDEPILMLVPHKQYIEKEMQLWTEWTNNKVMQAARKLGKDQAELKTLRQEKEEREKFKEQSLEENTTTLLSQMESALSIATGHIDNAHNNLHRLEEESKRLKRDKEAASDKAMTVAASLHAAVLTEEKTLMKLKSLERQKDLVEEQLTILKSETSALTNRFDKAKRWQFQFQVLLNYVEKQKLKAQKEMDSARKKLEEEKELMKVEMCKRKKAAERRVQKCEDNITNLETMIAELKLEFNKIKIPSLNIGFDSPGSQLPKVSKRLAVFQDIFGEPDVKQERECIMCMEAEISVVFVPCAHQVLCGKCNELHEKQGMNECPSCRTPIQRRVSVSYRTEL